MEKEIYEQLMCKIKVFEKNIVNLPRVGEQIQYHLIHIIDDAERFKLIINKRGHKNPDNLTIMLYSMNQNSTMIRFDVNGSDHANPPNFDRIPTPHLHIMTDEYKNGTIAIPLYDIQNIELINEMIDALDFFMDYTKIKKDNIIIKP
ncbi:Uncharacterised protein [Staphylococcus pseudintermedius]|uniref:DUF6978 family protein n=1 Tax=Staphylococcus pseudintermedius TaxID=283734 RepID=UPI0010E5FB4A|nr:Uncharacterised protein [Staphylococcus pseudintermedius]